jgi:hypothetical protein
MKDEAALRRNPSDAGIGAPGRRDCPGPTHHPQVQP